MAQPIWQTAAGSLGVIPEGVFYQQTLTATDADLGPVTYSVIAGALPAGVQCTPSGQIVGVPTATASLQGVPTSVNQDVTSKFVIRASATGRIADRTFTLTVTGNDVPKFETPAGPLSIPNPTPESGPEWIPAGTFYDGDLVNIQILYTDDDPEDTAVVSLASGLLPPGLSVSPRGLIFGYIRPATPLNQTPGYDETAADQEPYDFVVDFVSRNYQFTLEVNDGKSSDLRQFTMFVYSRNEMTADVGVRSTEPPFETNPSWATADNSFVTADETNNRAPFLTNAVPSDLGRVRSDNYFSYRFIGNDYDTQDISYAISVNTGFGLPPGLELDPATGWLYGVLPDQGTTEVEYSFNITVYQTQPVETSVECTATAAGTNRITCTSTTSLGVGEPLKFSGTALGGISLDDNTLYYVLSIVDEFRFTIAASPTSTVPVTLTTSTGSMTASPVIASRPYPFSLTIVGAIDSEITWLTDSDLGTIVNGETSLLRVEAVNRGGRELQYRLASGQFNSLPQGLELLPSGDIAGRVTFNTFAIDLGDTTFDSNQTIWDSEFDFVVNAYAPDTQQLLYNVSEIAIVNGGSGYNPLSPPTIVFETPVGASAVQAVAGNVTIVSGSITAVQVSNNGAGYTGPATITITEGFGGSGAALTAVMQITGTRDVVSVFKQFSLRVIREYNAPYQNLYVQAMPPEADRVLIQHIVEQSRNFCS